MAAFPEEPELLINELLYVTYEGVDGGYPYHQLKPTVRFTRESVSWSWERLLHKEWYSDDSLIFDFDEDNKYLNVEFRSNVTLLQLDLVLETILNAPSLEKIIIRTLSYPNPPGNKVEELFFNNFYELLRTRPELIDLRIVDPIDPNFTDHGQEIHDMLAVAGFENLRVIDLHMSSKFTNNDVYLIARGVYRNKIIQSLRIQGSTGMNESCLTHFISPLLENESLKYLKVFWNYKPEDIGIYNEQNHKWDAIPEKHTSKLLEIYQSIRKLYVQSIFLNNSLLKFDYYHKEWIKWFKQPSIFSGSRLLFFDSNLENKIKHIHDLILTKLRENRNPSPMIKHKLESSHAAGKMRGGCKKHACCQHSDNDIETQRAVENYRYLQQVLRNGGRIRIEYE